MTLLLVQALNGVQLGLLLFLIAAGLTLVFGVMNFINLAHGVQYMLGAYLGVAFTTLTGSFWLGLVLACIVAGAVGIGLERLVFRHLYARDHLDQVLATFGVILCMDEIVRMIWGSAPMQLAMPRSLSGSIPLMGGLHYPVYRLALIVAGLLVAGLLAWVVNRTRAGMLIRAGASNAAMVSALGVDIGRLFTLVFGVGAMLAGFAGVLAAPLVSVEPGMGANLLILAFVVIVVGGTGAIRGAFIAALLVGLTDTVGRGAVTDAVRGMLSASAAARVGPAIASMLIYILMAAVLAIRPQGLFPVARMRWLAGPVLIFAALAAIPMLPVGGYTMLLVSRAMVFALAALSLDLILGAGGMVSFGHAAFLAIGAYAVAILDAADCNDAWIVLPAAGAAAALFAAVTGAIALRTRGVNFIMITLAFAQMIYFGTGSLADYGGDDGYSLVARTELFGARVLRGPGFYWCAFVLLAGGYAACRILVASRFGRALRAVKQNHVRAQALGFSPFALQLTAYVIAGTICAVAGVMLANDAEFVSPAHAAWQRSGDLLIMVILGGVGGLHGAILGAAAVVLLEDGLGHLTEHWRLIYGPLLVLAVLFFRGGLAGIGARRG